jgi:hypothetical protein
LSTHDFDPILRPCTVVRRHGPRLLVLSAAALLLHAAVLGGATWAWPSGEPPRLPAAAMQVRVVEPPPAAVEIPVPVVEAAPPAVVAPKPILPRPALRARPVVVRAPSAPPRAAPATEPQAEEPLAAPPVQLALAMPTLVAAAPAAAPPAADDESIPHYRTRLPPAATLRYEVSRGMLHGTGDLVWRPQADRYELKLDFKLSGLTILSQASSGAFDAAGIAPVRFTDQRFKRGTTAANFQREADKITYSGSASEFALRSGAQDRLSWMMQLAAIVAAEPQLAKPGAKVVMYVTGAHGDAGVWVFRCIGPEAVELRGAPVNAVKFIREPREPYDTAVQVWLDPKQHDLPVRATQKSGANDEGYELRLLEVRAAN